MAKILTGIVTSDSRDKTITVTVTSRDTHPIYKKQYTVTRKYQAHDEQNEARLGDKVQISEIRPVSKTKAFTLQNIEERAHGTVELKDEVLGVTESEPAKTVDAEAPVVEEKA
jgi:small subunit ribosomal protein S17